MNWYSHNIIHAFAMDSATAKKVDFRRWVQIHKLLCKRLGIDTNDCDMFYRVSEMIARLTDKLERLPRLSDLLFVWDEWQSHGFQNLDAVVEKVNQ